MEVTAAASRTGSKTMADLIPGAVAELADIVQELALGLIDLGIQPGDRICILANTRPDWSYVDMAATSTGAVVVPIYPTNSPEECLWVISDSEASTIVCENEEQCAKIEVIREQLPALHTVIVIEPGSGGPEANGSADVRPALQTVTLEELRERGRSHSPDELEARRAAVSPEDPFTF